MTEEERKLFESQSKRLDNSLKFFLLVADYLQEETAEKKERIKKIVDAGLPAAKLRATAKTEGPIKDLFDKLGL